MAIDSVKDFYEGVKWWPKGKVSEAIYDFWVRVQ